LAWPGYSPEPDYFEQSWISVLDREIDWSDWLPTGDSIASSAWTCTGYGLTVTDGGYTTATTTVWIGPGGVPSHCLYGVTNTITTTGGRTADRTLRVRILPVPTRPSVAGNLCGGGGLTPYKHPVYGCCPLC